jgi:PAS domain S-box-containing protein
MSGTKRSSSPEKQQLAIRYESTSSEERIAELEARLETWEERFRLLSGTCTDFVYAGHIIADPATPPELDWLMGAAEAISGYTFDEIRALPRRWHSLILPEDFDGVRRGRARLLQGNLATNEYRIRTKSGEVRWIRDFVRPVPDPDGGPIRRIFGAIRDTTAEKEAERALRESEERLRWALEASHEALWDWDLETDALSRNRRFYEFLGYGADELPSTGEACLELIHPDDRARVREAVKAHLRGETEDLDTVYRTTALDGSYRWLHSRGRVFVRGDDGRPLRMIGVIADITKRKRAEAALRESEEVMRYIIKYDPNAIAVYDNDLRYIAVSDRYLHDYGVEDADILGRHHYEVFPEIPERWRAVHRRCLAGAVERNDDDSFVRQDGSVTYNRWECRPWRRPDGSIGGIITYTEVTTERKKLEERIRQMQKMEAIGHLAGGIAHDFNNQLAPIMGYADLLQARLGESDLARYARLILSGARRASDLTKHLLAFARKGKYLSVPVDIHALVAEVIGLLEHSIDKRIAIVQQFGARLHTVRGDPSQLQSIVMNIALNARDAMPEGGTLRIATRNLDLDEARCRHLPFEISPGTAIELLVADDGCGMDEATRARIFEPFFTTKDEGKGTGMGLAAVYGAVTNHAGAITVETAPGEGTTLRVLLPAGEAEPHRPEPPPEEIPYAEPLHVLFVDDEEDVRHLAADMLRILGHRVTPAVCGREAVEAVEAAPEGYDLVILDMIMPRMSGPEAFGKIRQIAPELPVLVCSGHSLDAAAQAILREARTGYLRKPFRMHELAAAIARTVPALRESPLPAEEAEPPAGDGRREPSR